MARLTYSAPGVYVEEIPSAQQPIAGVGTSTAAFIGVIPDNVIEYPVRNENYNPKAAQINFKILAFKNKLQGSDLEDATKEEKDYLNKVKPNPIGSSASGSSQPTRSSSDLQNLRDAVTTAQRTVETAKAAVDTAQADIESAPEDQKVKKRQALTRAEATLGTAKEAMEKAETAEREANTTSTRPTTSASSAPAVADVLKPYVLKTFKIEVNPCETKLCTNFTEYTNYFGSFSADDQQYSGHRALTHAVYGFFLNGGMRCFVTIVQSPDQLDNALKMVESIDEVAIVAAPGFDVKSTTWLPLENHCENAQDRFAILDYDEDVKDLYAKEYKFKDKSALEGRLTYDNENNDLPQRSNYAAFYFPWIEVLDPAKQLQDQDLELNIDGKYQGRVYVPPSGHIAGIYARTDVERGVHKAPANCAIRGAINVKYYVSKGDQEGLNPQGVNCIRNINGNIAVWGARTIGGDHNLEWKYINVRRTMLFLRESIEEGTQWVVFEPNDIALWGKIRRNVSAFLTIVWRSGALFGATPEEAFYVKCDAELNPPEVRDLGQVVTEIGVAIVRPAEFVIFRISQSTGSKV
jgi:phage tail sheath protein FI